MLLIYSTRVDFRDEISSLANVEVVSALKLLVDLNKNERETRSLVILNDAVSSKFLFRDALQDEMQKTETSPALSIWHYTN